MKFDSWRTGGVLSLCAAAALLVPGCGQTDNKGGQTKGKGDKSKSSQVAQAKKDDHSGWWCAEHGIPEDVCSMCSAKVAADFKKKGDWCKEHDRADSQCFICHPELKAKFAAMYRAKYGKEPPPTEDEETKDEKKG